MSYDAIVKNGRWFDGTGAPSATRHLGIRDGRVATVSAAALDETDCPRVIDAAGKWVIPGMLDIHTHYDVEVLLRPQLDESVRHGVTTVFVGSCSLSTVHVGPSDAGDLFGRVEAIPVATSSTGSRSARRGTRHASTSTRSNRCRWERTSRRSSATPTCGRR